ncbi:hypothetical protein KQH61_04665 [bacterium]|nr:hypothetical protein [bacterium]MCB2179197.1 hypothetical protein [bacterium]
MRIEWPWKSQKITIERDLQKIETQLSKVLQPVEPRVDFIKNLRAELVGEPEKKAVPAWRTGVLVAGGVVSFFAMVFGGVRIVVTILAKINKQKVIKEVASA